MLQVLPREIRSQIGGYIANDLQAVDPRCYRACRSVQAAWRGWAIRFQRWRCNFCRKRTSRRIVLRRGRLGRSHASRLQMSRHIPFAYLSLPPLDCNRCHNRRIPFEEHCRWFGIDPM